MQGFNPTTIEGVEVAEIGRKTQKSPPAGMFSHPDSVYIPDGTFQDVGRDIRYEIHNYNSGGERRLARREESSTSSTRSELPSQLYSRLLIQEGRGYPLLDAGPPNELPQPYQLHGMMVGDVGIVTQDGYFDVLFNICEPAEGLINRNCVPEGFKKLERPPDNGHNYRRGTAYEPGAWAISDNVQVTSSPLMNRDTSGTYTFKCGSAEGAILALPRGASREDLVNHGTFLKYASDHGVSWYEFVNGHLGRGVPNGSIYLITGYDKTSAWGSASCPSSSMSSEFEMRFTCTRWDQPGLRRVIHKQVQNSQLQSPLPNNQCTFLRGYKVTLSNRILASIRGISIVETWPMDRIEEPDQRKVFNLLGIGDGLGSVLRDILGGRSSSAPNCDGAESESDHPILTSTVSPLSLANLADLYFINQQYIHPSNLINQYLLSKFPESDLAVTHDSVWCSYLEMQKHQESPSSLLEYINLKCTPIQEHGTIYLVNVPEPTDEPTTDAGMHDPNSTDVDMSGADLEGVTITPDSPPAAKFQQVLIPPNAPMKEEKPDIDTPNLEARPSVGRAARYHSHEGSTSPSNIRSFMGAFQNDRDNFVGGHYNNVRGNYNNNYNGSYFDLEGNTSPYNMDSFNRSKRAIINSFYNNDVPARVRRRRPQNQDGYNGTTLDFDEVYGGKGSQPPPPLALLHESRRAPTRPAPAIIAPTSVPNARKASNNPFEPYYNGNFDRQASIAEGMNRLTIPEHSPWQEGGALVSEPEDLASVFASSRTYGSSMYTNDRPARSRSTFPLPFVKPETLDNRPPHSRGNFPLPFPKPELLNDRPARGRSTSPLPVPETMNDRPARGRSTSPLPVPEISNDRPVRSHGTSPLPVPRLEILDDSTALSIASRITSVISDKASYQKLLREEWATAQRLVDVSQAVLESPTLDAKLRRVLVVTIQQFAKRAGVYPRAYKLDGVKKMGKGCIADGAYGTVHRGYYQNRNVCLKALKQDSRNTGMNLHLSKAVAREAILWRQLDHRNILPFYGICELEIGLCMVSPWMRQGNLREYMRGGTVTGEERLLVAKDVAEGLKYLHSYEIIHGDLKGENVLVDGVGRARIADFGLTSIDDPAIAYWASQSRVASRGGNFAFQAPEIIDKDEADNTKASDMYAYGCVCYELYFGEEPWKGSKREVMARKLNNELPKCPEESSIVWKCGLTQTIWSLMEETWRFQPDQRPYASEVVEKLSKMIDRDHRDLEEDEQDPEAEFITRWCRGRSEDDPVSSGMRQKFMIPTLEEVEELLRLP